MITAAAIQLSSHDNLAENMQVIERLVSEAASQQAKLIVLPENFAMMSDAAPGCLNIQETLGEGPIQDQLAAMARRHQVILVGGSMPIYSSDQQRYQATCVVYDESGEQIAHYHKIHLFDVRVSATEAHCESERVVPGTQPVTCDTSIGRLGLSICYDLRFPELYRQLMLDGAEIVVVPAAFTQITGAAHWDILCRARAVENLVYLIGANQCGQHSKARATYGHSMIVDYWGRVLSQCDNKPGIIYAPIDLPAMRQQREQFPVLEHLKMYQLTQKQQ